MMLGMTFDGGEDVDIPRNEWHFKGRISLENTDWGLPPMKDGYADALGDAMATAAVEILKKRAQCCRSGGQPTDCSPISRFVVG